MGHLENKKPKPGGRVILTGLPFGFLDDLPMEDQKAISVVVGKPVILNEYNDDGRAELEFKDGNIHFIRVNPDFIKTAK